MKIISVFGRTMKEIYNAIRAKEEEGYESQKAIEQKTAPDGKTTYYKHKMAREEDSDG